MSNGDFTDLANELSAFVSNLVFEKNANRDDELTRAEINKLKGKLSGSLPAIFNSTEAATRVISRFVLTPNSESKTLPQLIMEETESYPPQTGYMCEPITFPREDHFQVLTGQDIDWDAAWRVLFFLLRLKCADLSAEAAQDEIKNLKMLAGEDPNALRDRLVGLVERVNLPHDSTSKVISLQTAGLFMLQALPEHLAGIVRERFSKAMNVTDEHTLTEVTDVAQDVHTSRSRSPSSTRPAAASPPHTPPHQLPTLTNTSHSPRPNQQKAPCPVRPQLGGDIYKKIPP
ncbi:hypothetical protein CYMTET_32150 [Cymbomonas tetramitiformis]|uniref:Uncharacterized protein n=1 Tax=Cymbomonas tetramitiformis TaxID=36881 RepID=A0AAE0FFJ9_9CHLO|nr:hypothetical protein CYMTET_32150 [Cymbomonas tetramitiformis]